MSLKLNLFRQVRSYASQSFDAPGIGGRYATALFNAAKKSNSLDVVSKDLEQINNVAQTDSLFKSFLDTPLIGKEDKSKGITEYLNKVGKFHNDTVNVFGVLAENGRLSETKSVIESFQNILKQYKQQMEIKVTSTTKLDSKTLKKIQDLLSKSKEVPKGADVTITNVVDSGIKGGLVVDFGGRTLDLSVASRIAKYNQLLQTN